MVTSTDKTPPIVVMKFVAELIPYSNNSRTHSDEQVVKLAASIKEYGFTNPVLIDGKNGIIAGHGRIMAARKLGMKDVPCIVLDHLTDAQRRAYVLADNRLALDSDWDDDMTAVELQRLQADGFDLSMTGFDPKELEDLLKVMPGSDPPVTPDGMPATVPIFTLSIVMGSREQLADLQVELTGRGFFVKLEEGKGEVKT